MMMHAWSDRDVTRPLDFFFARDWHVTSMSDHVPDKKTVTSQFHSTLIETRILKGQNGGRRIRNREARRSRLMKINGCKGRKAMDWKSRVTEGEDWISVSVERNKNLIQNIQPKNAGTSNWRCGCQNGIGERLVEGTGWCSCWIWWVQGGCARCFKSGA